MPQPSFVASNCLQASEKEEEEEEETFLSCVRSLALGKVLKSAG
jgi:hypothetical protein